MTELLVAVAALWGAAAGSLLPRAAYRYSVPSGEPWRETCPVQSLSSITTSGSTEPSPSVSCNTNCHLLPASRR